MFLILPEEQKCSPCGTMPKRRSWLLCMHEIRVKELRCRKTRISLAEVTQMVKLPQGYLQNAAVSNAE